MKKNFYCILVMLLTSANAQVNDSISLDSIPVAYSKFSLTPINDSVKDFKLDLPMDGNQGFFQKPLVKKSIAPVILFAAAGATWGEREHIREIRNRYIPTFRHHYDDYLQYSPAVATFGLKAAGIKGRNNLGRTAISYGASLLIMGAIVNSIKYTAKVERPDGSSRNSFPSGHTSNSFMNATFLHKEYGLVSPAYSIGGYSVATITGLGRGLNNRHWISDVLAGAGIGIISTELGYFFVNKFYKNEGDNIGLLSKIENHNGHPSFIALKAGAALSVTNFLKESELDDDKETGLEMGLEGAYFFSKNWGIGGSFGFSSFTVKPLHFDFDDPELGSMDIITESLGFLNVDLGPYYAHHFSDDWLLMLKATGGYSFPAHGKVLVKGDLIDQLDEEEAPNGELVVAEYRPSRAFRFSTGAALTYKFNPELGLSAYVDYHHSNAKISYLYDEVIEDDEGMNTEANSDTVKEKIRYFTVGLRLTAFF
ncbi:MAG: phosphatase PAP2 family protein [Weeksellaceae bacterium]